MEDKQNELLGGTLSEAKYDEVKSMEAMFKHDDFGFESFVREFKNISDAMFENGETS